MLLTPDTPPPPAHARRKLAAILVTVGIHLGLGILAALSTVLPRPEDKPELLARIEAPETDEVRQVEKRTVKKHVDQVVAAAPPMNRLLRSNQIALTAVPDMTRLTDTPVGLGQGNLGVGFGAAQTRNLGRGAMFFGQQVTGNLGVVFDVSPSMHPYVSLVVDEIMRNFRNAMVICVNSANLIDETTPITAVPYDGATNQTASVPYLGSEEARRMHEDLLTLPNCWYIAKDVTSLGAAVEHLIGEGIATVFVFSDFQDTVVPTYLEELERIASRAGAKVNLQVLQEPRSYEPALQELARKTGGRYAKGELLARAGKRR
jgi:hypothetical protein